MKGYQRRAAGKPNYWKLAIWDVISCCWRDGKKQHDTEEKACESAREAGRYRLSFVEDGVGRHDKGEFSV